MRKALPNACFLGFTGTPIDKKDRSTLQTFGPYIDTYTIEQAVRTAPRCRSSTSRGCPTLRIIGQSLDKVFDRVFADRIEEEREAIKKRYATEEAIAGGAEAHRGDLPRPHRPLHEASSSRTASRRRSWRAAATWPSRTRRRSTG